MKTYIKTTLTILISGMLFSSCEDQLNQHVHPSAEALRSNGGAFKLGDGAD